MSDDREEKTLEGGVQLVAERSTSYTTHRHVRLRAPDPEYKDSVLEVSVGHSTQSYRPDDGSPRLDLLRNYTGFSRKQWEEFKRLGDRAWVEYEARFGAK